MIVRSFEDCYNSERRVTSDTWESVRMLLKDDRMGFSFHITRIFAGTETPIHYQNHLESVYCLSGEGEVETCDDGKIHKIRPGVLYILDKHDKHLLRAADDDLVMACVFNPPLVGDETHDKNGVYPLDPAVVDARQKVAT